MGGSVIVLPHWDCWCLSRSIWVPKGWTEAAAFGFWVNEFHIKPFPAIDHSLDCRTPMDTFQPGGIAGVKGDKKPGMFGGGREWAVPVWSPHSPRVVL